MNLEADDVHLWMTRCSTSIDPVLLREYRSLLSSSERERQQSFGPEKNRRRDMLTRVLLRTTLSRYSDTNPRDWRFRLGLHGKPEISEPASTLKFNLSHSEDYIVLAVTRQYDVGVDIEYIRRKSDYAAIADRYFSDPENVDLAASPIETRRGRFYDYWTLKEAHVKARGLGLAASLSSFSIALNQDNGAEITFYGESGERSVNWQFWRFLPVTDYRMALALRCGQDTVVKLSMFETIPLRTTSCFEALGM